MIDRVRIFFAQQWAGLATALFVIGMGVLLKPLWGWVGLVPGCVLMLGAVYAVMKKDRTPPPGKRYSVKGGRMHLLAEGAAGKRRPVIWVSGGHGEGLIMHHLHKVMREETRSILFDRTGSGWSSAPRKPVTISDEVSRLNELLDAAGEEGPFVVAGHSFGGLFATNFTHAFPERVAGLVLLDATPPWNVAYAGELTFPPIIAKAWRGAIASHFGFGRFVEAEIDDLNSKMAHELADVAALINRHSVTPKSLLAEASIFRSCLRNPFDLVEAPGALGNIPLTLMTPQSSESMRQEIRQILIDRLGLDDRQISIFMSGWEKISTQQLALSSNSRHVVLPEGATHMFPYEHPARVLEEVRSLTLLSDESS